MNKIKCPWTIFPLCSIVLLTGQWNIGSTLKYFHSKKYDWKYCLLFRSAPLCLDGFHDDVIKWKYFWCYWPLGREFTSHRWIPSQRPVTRSFDVFFDLQLKKHLSKQSSRRWFETPSRSLWRHCNVEWVSPQTAANTFVPTQCCSYQFYGAKAPSHQYPHCRTNMFCWNQFHWTISYS